MLRKLLVNATSTVFAVTVSVSVNAADVVVGAPGWASANVTSYVIKQVLENNLGLEVEVQNGSNPIIWEAMDKGDMDVHPEVWLPNQQNLYQTYVVENGTVVQNPNPMLGWEGICVTQDTAKMHGITSISDLSDPSKTDVLDTNGDGRGEIWIGATGWASTNIEKIRAKSYGYDQMLELLEIDESTAMAQIDAAITQKKPYVFACWSPHHVWNAFDPVKLEEPPYDGSKWHVLQPTEDPDWLAKSTAPTAWDDKRIHVHYAKALETRSPEAARVLSKIKLRVDEVSAWVYAVMIEKQDPASVAENWINNNAAVVDSWLE